MTPSRRQHAAQISDHALWYVYMVIAAGSAALEVSLADGLHVASPLVFATYLGLAVVASVFKMGLPGIEGTYSLNTLFILFGLYYLSPGETVIVGCAAIVAQSLWNARQTPSILQIIFNIANVALSIGAAFAVTNIAFEHGAEAYRPALMAAAAFVQFAVNTLVVSGILSLLEDKPLDQIWLRWFEWSFPYYAIGAALVALLPFHGRVAQPEAWIILLPLFYLVHFFYGLSITARASGGPGEELFAGELLPRTARIYMSAVMGIGGMVLARALVAFDGTNLVRFAGIMVLGVVASTWKVQLPGMPVTISAGFVVTLYAIAALPFSHAVAIGAASCLTQVLWKEEPRAPALQSGFSVASLAIATALACWAVQNAMPRIAWAQSVTATLAIATVLLFGVNSLLISTAICLNSAKPLQGVWEGCYFWSFPYYLAGAGAAGLMVMTSRIAGWPASVIVLALMGMLFISYRRHVGNAVARGAALAGAAPEITEGTS
jgi:hypothetical protein